MGKRAWQYPEATGITNDDVILLDSATGGSRSIKANKIGSVLINKTLTERGTFDAADDNVDGYKKVTVDVPYTNITDVEGKIATFENGEDFPLAGLKCQINPIQEGSGDPSPTNIRPISGWDEANVTSCGKNLIASSTLVSDTYINQNTGEEIPYNGWTSTDYIPIEQNKWYRLLKLVDGSYVVNTGATVYWACYDENFNFVRGSVGDDMKDFTSNAKWLRTSSQTALMNKAILCEDSDVSSFVTESDFINGNNYNIDLDGTRYGGTLDVVSGVLTVDRYVKTFTGTENISRQAHSNNRFYYAITDIMVELSTSTMKGSILPPDNTIVYANDKDKIFYWYSGYGIYWRWDDYTSEASMQTKLAELYANGTPLQMLATLATPLIIQLTPTQVKSLLGHNNVWADTGDIIASFQTLWVQPDFTN